MRYSTIIDNITSIKWGLNIQESYLFSFIFEARAWTNTIEINGLDYFFLSRNKVVKEIPLLTTKTDTIYRYYKSLESLGLIIYIKDGKRDFICITDKGKQWNNSTIV